MISYFKYSYNLLCLTIDEISTGLFNLKSNLSLPINEENYPNPDECNYIIILILFQIIVFCLMKNFF
jgi:hypothetical protein